jgi:hypothetical protein
MIMIKNILLLIITAFISLSVPAMNNTNSSEQMNNAIDMQDITISVVGSNVHITGANGQTLYIYNVTGMCVDSFKIEGADKRYELNLPKGCYILKVGNTVRKISLR